MQRRAYTDEKALEIAMKKRRRRRRNGAGWRAVFDILNRCIEDPDRPETDTTVMKTEAERLQGDAIALQKLA